MAKRKSARKKAPKLARSGDGEGHYSVHLISASTGDVLYRMACVGVTQFSEVSLELVPHTLVDDLDKLDRVLRLTSKKNAIVIHALADPAAKQQVRSFCVARRTPHFDATGPMINFLADCVGQLPDNDISQLHQVDAAYQQRIEAMEFALEHDDGLGLTTLNQADVVIVGVSRVSKSPTTLYLSARGYKVANVSVVPERPFPKELSRVSKKKIVALTTQPKRLHEIRTERMKLSGVPGTKYDDLSSVIREVVESEKEYRRRGYPIVDVTKLTIEQTAAHILEALSLRPRRRPQSAI